jgi:hypothetical protein
MASALKGLPMDDDFKVRDVARIRSGKYAGLVGEVTETMEEGGQQTGVRVNIQGVRNSEPVSVHIWFKRTAVERNTHGA